MMEAELPPTGPHRDAPPPPLLEGNPFLPAAPPPVVDPLPVLVEPPPVVPAEPPPPPEPPPGPWPRALAGLESGVLGAAVMIGWFALDAVTERQYWWAMLNLWGAASYQNRVFSMGLGKATLAGASMHFVLHGVAGALWGLAGGRIANYWLHLAASFGAAACWYLLLMEGFWPLVAPVVSRITPVPATYLAYVLFGAALSRTVHRARQLRTIEDR
jgi:hypothetical protein